MTNLPSYGSVIVMKCIDDESQGHGNVCYKTGDRRVYVGFRTDGFDDNITRSLVTRSLGKLRDILWTHTGPDGSLVFTDLQVTKEQLLAILKGELKEMEMAGEVTAGTYVLDEKNTGVVGSDGEFETAMKDSESSHTDRQKKGTQRQGGLAGCGSKDIFHVKRNKL